MDCKDNTRDDDDELRERASGDRCRQLTSQLETNGILHPIHAAMNSRCS